MPFTERQCRARVQAKLDEIAVLGAGHPLVCRPATIPPPCCCNVRSEPCSSVGLMLTGGSRLKHLGTRRLERSEKSAVVSAQLGVE